MQIEETDGCGVTIMYSSGKSVVLDMILSLKEQTATTLCHFGL